jgi:hypothetical protein
MSSDANPLVWLVIAAWAVAWVLVLLAVAVGYVAGAVLYGFALLARRGRGGKRWAAPG